MNLSMRCACGDLRGALRSVSPRVGNRVVCYCDDCQSFAYFLGRADSILDPQGGTDIFQTSHARLAITTGAENLACMRLRPDGVLRWYAGCCRTPIGNTPATRQVPLVGLIHSCIDLAATGLSTDELLGPVRTRVFRRFARGGPDLVARARPPVFLIPRLARMVLAARLRGDHLRSPFFQPTGELAVAPRVLSPEELRAVESARNEAHATRFFL
jgi:hypothetical protein